MLGKFYWFLRKPITRWLMEEKPPRKFPLSDFACLEHELRPADVILVEGRSRVSQVIKMITQSAWSHSALYIGRMHDVEDVALRKIIARNIDTRDNPRLIIEGMIGEGTIISRLDSYCNDHMRICRAKGLSGMDAQKIIGFAVKSVGRKEYHLRHLIDIGRFLLPWSIMPKRWRSTLFQDLDNEEICSSLIAKAFEQVQFPILPYVRKHEETGIELIPRNHRLFVPSDFDYSPYFEIIKYPMLNVEGREAYKELPWTDEKIVSNDKGHFKTMSENDDLNSKSKT